MSVILQQFTKFSEKIDSYGVEIQGIHRYLPDERSKKSLFRELFTVTGLWISGCGGLTSMSSYFLGPLIFGLGYRDSFIYGILGTLIGCLVAAYCSTMGPRSGLRQMCSARYLFGRFGVRFVSLVNVVGVLGWSVTNCVLGGEILKSMSGGGVPLEVGIVIISVVSLIVALFGIHYVLKFETFIGIPVIIVVLLMYPMNHSAINNESYRELQSYGDYMTVVGDRISFFTLAYSVTATWGGLTSDYYVLLPETFPQMTTFIYTFFAIAIPTTFGAVIGILIGNAAVGNELWYDTYESESLGGLLNLVFGQWNGFGKFLLIILWLSLITNNVNNSYSSAIDIQLIDKWFYKHLPRWFIVFIVFAITLICSMVGKDKFSTILSNFLPMLGYWISIYTVMLFEENVIFRSTSLIKLYTIPSHCTTTCKPYYNFNLWDQEKLQTTGYAATLAFLFGVAGAILGMNQVYYRGKLASLIGDYGADLGTFLCFAFPGLTYPLFRYIELKKLGK
ncbi:hypothetical protein CANARDRAFT_198181 [[Candida] arabinofermentans NRRL YB-2248]|uniref:Uncharacterized protein n=1 Tax=[Candida] arabinofermentans NRRL YB-2248 TaxID=983967 RepID=A0A1E4T2A4_9ASCO|nr:hypothetical protein CANARDRAFT_198181 [[Candida] arabinofermentans NRRL YB-2248]